MAGFFQGSDEPKTNFIKKFGDILRGKAPLISKEKIQKFKDSPVHDNFVKKFGDILRGKEPLLNPESGLGKALSSTNKFLSPEPRAQLVSEFESTYPDPAVYIQENASKSIQKAASKKGITPEKLKQLAVSDFIQKRDQERGIIRLPGSDIDIGAGADFAASLEQKGIAQIKKLGNKLLNELAETADIATIREKLVDKGIELKDEFLDLITKEKNPKNIKEIISLGISESEPKVVRSVIDSLPQTKETQILKQASQALPPIGTVTNDPAVAESFKKTKNVLQRSWQSMRQVVDDSMIRLKNLERTPGVNLASDALSPWESKQLLASRTAARLTELKSKALSIVDEIKVKAKETGAVDTALRKDVNELLIAEHAPERNARVGKERAAGISNEEALAKIEEIKLRDNYKQIRELADKIRDLNKEVLDVLHQGGLITKSLVDELRTDYKKHVPLMRVMDDKLTDTINMMGSKLDVQQSGIKAAKGSKRQVEDILENVVYNYEKAILLAEKNKFAQSFLDFAEMNAHTGLFKVLPDSPTIVPTDPRYFGVRVNGKQKWVYVDDHNLGAALKGINMDRMPGFLKFSEVFSMVMSQLATRFNPDYLLSGFIRDTQEMIVAAAASKDIRAAGALAKIPKSQKAIIDFIRGVDNESTRLYKQFIKDGGGMGSMALSTKPEKIKIDLALHKSKPKKFAESFVKKMDSLNEIFENANRFAVYQEGLSKGLSRDKSALLAQESTINFSRKGTGGPVINGLYMFANASIQGSTKMLRAMKNPKVALGTALTVGATVELTNQWNDAIDPEWRTKIPSTTRSQNLIVLLPSSDSEDLDTIKIPVSWGLRPFKVTADTLSDVASTGKFNATKTINEIGSAVIDGYNPLGGSSLRQALTPSILDVLFDIAANEKYSGSPIKPETYGKPIPESERYFDSLKDTVVGRGFVSGAAKLADAVGIEISPADMKYAYEQYVGGTGRFVTKVTDTFTSLATGEEVSSYDIPIAGRFYQSIDAQTASATQEKSSGLDEILMEQERTRSQESRSVRENVERIAAMETPEEKVAALKQIKAQSEKMHDDVLDKLMERSFNYTAIDRKIKQLGVENGERAKYVVSSMKDMTIDERRAYIIDLHKRKVISDEVLKQIKYLMTH